MTSSIDPIRGPRGVRRTRKTDAHSAEDAGPIEDANRPVPVGKASTIPPREPAIGGAAIEAQLMGQTGARRGLRAGATAIDTAKASYNKAEWSGAKDRRTPTGRVTKTDV